jgi:hypothetical protein
MDESSEKSVYGGMEVIVRLELDLEEHKDEKRR